MRLWYTSCERAHFKLSENTSLTFAYDRDKFQLRFKKRNLLDIFLALKIANLYENANVQSIYAKDLQDFTVGIPVKYHHNS